MASQSTTVGALAVAETHVTVATPAEDERTVAVVNTSDGYMIGYVGSAVAYGTARQSHYVTVRSLDGAWLAPENGLTREHALIRLGILVAERYTAQGGTA